MGVTKSFGGVTAVRDFSLKVSQGETMGLIGPNGAGKTTLFNLIAGQLSIDDGSIHFQGADLRGLKPHQRVSLGMSRTFQIARPFARMTVAENVLAGALFGRGSRSNQDAYEKTCALLDLVSLAGKGGFPAGSLTLADQRRLDLARALATSPRLLMLDEVMAGLSPVERVDLVGLLGRVAREEGLAMIVSEHVMEAVVSLCGRLVVMDRGAKLTEGETSAVLKSELVAEAYLGTALGPRPVRS